jgi:hypothetical protein
MTTLNMNNNMKYNELLKYQRWYTVIMYGTLGVLSPIFLSQQFLSLRIHILPKPRFPYAMLVSMEFLNSS